MVHAAADEVTVYVDVKSPHAYLILQPALQIAVDYKVRVEFKPYQLCEPSCTVELQHCMSCFLVSRAHSTERIIVQRLCDDGDQHEATGRRPC